MYEKVLPIFTTRYNYEVILFYTTHNLQIHSTIFVNYRFLIGTLTSYGQEELFFSKIDENKIKISNLKTRVRKRYLGSNLFGFPCCDNFFQTCNLITTLLQTDYLT